MEPKLFKLIVDYQRTVRAKFEQLRTELGIETPQSGAHWVCTDVPQKGVLSDGTKYFKHGFGCAMRFSDGFVDFDFGEHGELTGFDPSRLWSFAQYAISDYGFASQDKITAAMKEAESRGELNHAESILYHLSETSEAW